MVKRDKMESTEQTKTDASSSNKRRVTLDLTTLIIATLLLVIAVMLFVWKPWNSTISADTRKITISGEATVKAEPDEYQFNPYYELETTEQATKLNNEIVAKLKELGVKDEQIKNNASSYGSPEIYYMAPAEDKEVTTLSFTITINDKELTQKVQDYLLTTDPKGSITPYPTFSTAKRQELEDQVRNEAIENARTKAESTAQALGAEVGKVIEVSEGGSIGYGCSGTAICMAEDSAVSSSETRDQSLTIQPGVDEFTYTVSVVFELK